MTIISKNIPANIPTIKAGMINQAEIMDGTP